MNVLARQIFGDAFSEFLRDYTTTLLAARKERRGECVGVAVYDAEDEGTCLRGLMMASARWPQNGSNDTIGAYLEYVLVGELTVEGRDLHIMRLGLALRRLQHCPVCLLQKRDLELKLGNAII